MLPSPLSSPRGLRLVVPPARLHRCSLLRFRPPQSRQLLPPRSHLLAPTARRKLRLRSPSHQEAPTESLRRCSHKPSPSHQEVPTEFLHKYSHKLNPSHQEVPTEPPRKCSHSSHSSSSSSQPQAQVASPSCSRSSPLPSPLLGRLAVQLPRWAAPIAAKTPLSSQGPHWTNPRPHWTSQGPHSSSQRPLSPCKPPSGLLRTKRVSPGG